MKKLLIVLLMILITTAPVAVQAGWRHHLFIVGGVIGLYHPNGDFWIWQCWLNPAGHNACSFKK